MGYDYALVHLKYTVPLALGLTLLYRPLATKTDVYKILFLVTVALVSTTPWDSYLIRNRIWTYPRDAVAGITLFDIPLEEYFFFVVQTYTTSLIYLICSKPTFHPIYLQVERSQPSNGRPARGTNWRYIKLAGQLVLALVLRYSVKLIRDGGHGTYLGMILIWATPFMLLLWTFSYQFIVGLPNSNTIIPVIIPTLYLWVVDALALQRGTWVIESGTKLGYQFYGLEFEEALFFLLTNTLIVWGGIAFDNALAILNTFFDLYPHVPTWPSPIMLIRALLLPAGAYNEDQILGLIQAALRLQSKSRSFFLASSTFQGRLRIDLTILYSFCRVADDLVDTAKTPEDARESVRKLNDFVDLSYQRMTRPAKVAALQEFIEASFPFNAQLALLQLPTHYLPQQPLSSLIKGLESDLKFAAEDDQTKPDQYPIATESDLDTYGLRVAGTVAELCIHLVFHHYPGAIPKATRERLLKAGRTMGIALQCVNISRDIGVDARLKRVYIPTSWLEEEDLTPDAVIKEPQGAVVEKLRQRMLDKAFAAYEEARGAIEDMPVEARAPMKVAVESYMEIGRVLRKPGYKVKAGRATVSKLRRLRVAWSVLSRG
ncbi:MAG: hypothetical protein M1821_007798 [Bathelium mastoideum]|nr:MAG: hypothetical protein M1821_007798 [Bathelium mastoideum]